jgi:hypothetical protein
MSEALSGLIGTIPVTAVLIFVGNFLLKKIEKTIERGEEHNLKIALLQKEIDFLKEQIKIK